MMHRSLVYVRYQDHTIFRNADPATQSPLIQEAVGWIQAENEQYIRLVVAMYREPRTHGRKSKTKATGFVILRNTIIEMRKVG